MQELIDVIRSLANGKAVRPDGVSVEVFKITINGDPALRRILLDIVIYIWRRGGVPQQRKCVIIMALHTKRFGQSTATTGQGHLAGSARQQNTAEDPRSPPQ